MPKKTTKKTTKKSAPKSERKPSDVTRVAIYSHGQRFLPQPRSLNTEQMAKALARVDLGQPFALTIGMQVVRKRRGEVPVVVTIAKDGFVMDGVTYPSLSAAAQWATKRAASGNDYFSVSAYGCTQVQGKGVPKSVYSRAGEGVEASNGDAASAREKRAPKAKSVSAKKAAAKKGKPPALNGKAKAKLAAIKEKAKAKAKALDDAPPTPTDDNG